MGRLSEEQRRALMRMATLSAPGTGSFLVADCLLELDAEPIVPAQEDAECRVCGRHPQAHLPCGETNCPHREPAPALRPGSGEPQDKACEHRSLRDYADDLWKQGQAATCVDCGQRLILRWVPEGQA